VNIDGNMLSLTASKTKPSYVKTNKTDGIRIDPILWKYKVEIAQKMPKNE
jgi:hypothetical protein